MSKAFTKEDDQNADDPEVEGLALPVGFKNYITQKGAVRLQEELRHLSHTERPEVVRTVAWAASNGDRSENGDYIYGKRRLREIDRRIRFITKRLESAEVVKVGDHQSSQIVRFGAWVTLESVESEGRSKRFRIVGIDETEPNEGLVSWISPLAKLVLGQKLGDVVLFRSPKGDEEEFEITAVRYLDDRD